MEHPTGEAPKARFRLSFDRRLKLEFHGSSGTSDAGLLAFRELNDALGLTELAGGVLADPRLGHNGRHTLTAQLRQAIFGRLAGYKDVNDADWVAYDSAMLWVFGGRALTEQTASASQMDRFETELLTQEANLSALSDLFGRWIDAVHARRPLKMVILGDLFRRVVDMIAALRPRQVARCLAL